MSANPRIQLAALLVVLSGFTACQREPAPPVETPEPAAPETAEAIAEPAPATIPGTDAISAVDNTTAEAGVQPEAATAAGLDARSFAGSFSAEGTTLALADDGTYQLEASGDQTLTGTWTIEDDGKRILLDPDSKSDEDSSYAVVSTDELKSVNDAPSLRRDGGP